MLQYLNMSGDNPTLATSLAPHEHPAAEESNQILHNHDDPIDDDDLLPFPTHPILRPLVPIVLRDLSGQFVPPLGHCIVTPPPRPTNPVESVKLELRYPIILGDKISVGVTRPYHIGQSVPCDG